MVDNEVSFQGEVAIVTGAGGGLGRLYAEHIARCGAKIMVNDVVEDDAVKTANSIKSAGGTAIVYVGSVADQAVTDAMVQTAINTWGHVDIIINNAGVSDPGPFAMAKMAHFDRMVDVNLRGSWSLTKAAWPYMAARGHGRVVMVSSATILGHANLATYAMTKMGLWGLTRSLALEGSSLGINVNVLAPSASTASAVAWLRANGYEKRATCMEKYVLPDYVSPVVAWLAHRDCTVTGECIEAVGRSALRYVIAETKGYTVPGANAKWTPEVVRDHWEEITSEDGQEVRHNTDESVEYTTQRLAEAAGEI